MRAKVAHALPSAGDKVAENKITKKYEWTILDHNALFSRIFKPELLKFLLKGKEQFNANLNTIQWGFSGTPFAIDKVLAETNMLKSAVSDKATVLKVLNENDPSKLLSDQDTYSEFAADIFSVTRNSPISLTMEFNQALFLQELEHIDDSISDTPAVAVKNKQISINVKPLIKYLHTTFNDLIVFNNNQGDLETILSNQELPLALSMPSRVQVLIDISSSMTLGFRNYIHVIKTALTKAFESCPQLQADITPFNHDYYTQSFNDPISMGNFLDTLHAHGATNINCPLKEAYHNVSINEHATVYLFTDGYGEGTCTEEELTKAAVAARQNPNMMSYSVEMGSSTDPLFFERLQSNTGFTNLIFLNSTQAIEKISGILADLCQQRELWSFLHKEHTQYVLLESGDLKRGPTIHPETQIMHNNQPVIFGTEQPLSITNTLYGMFQKTFATLKPNLNLSQRLLDFLPELPSPDLQQIACTLTYGMIAHAVRNMSCPDNTPRLT
jgi:hypothetical protein